MRFQSSGRTSQSCIGAGALLFVAFGVGVMVMLVNRPRFLVPPARRKEPGLVQMWIARIRR